MKKKNKNGFTLIEVLIALGVFSVAVLAAFALAMSNLRIAQENYDRVLSSNLAREGIELVRNIRDSNWLKIDANYDCDNSSNGLQFCAWDEGLADISFNCIDNTGFRECTDNSLYINSGLYGHGNAGQTTVFSREIILSDILDGVDKIGIKVISTVSWERHGKSFEEQAITNLYNWRK